MKASLDEFEMIEKNEMVANIAIEEYFYDQKIGADKKERRSYEKKRIIKQQEEENKDKEWEKINYEAEKNTTNLSPAPKSITNINLQISEYHLADQHFDADPNVAQNNNLHDSTEDYQVIECTTGASQQHHQIDS